MAEALVEVVSALTERGHPQYGECTLIVSDKMIEFKDGRARVTEDVAVLLVNRSDMHVLSAPEQWTAPPTPPGASEPTLEYENPGSVMAVTPEDRARDAARVEALSQGMDVPDFPIPQGFITHLEDEQRRCLAGKHDGSQCSNPARDGSWACGLGTHIEAVAALPRELPVRPS